MRPVLRKLDMAKGEPVALLVSAQVMDQYPGNTVRARPLGV